MVRIKYIIIFLLIAIGLNAQPYVVLPQPVTINAPDLNAGTFTQGTDTTVYIEVEHLTGFNPFKIEGITSSDSTLLKPIADSEMLPDSTLYEGKGWILFGGMDTTQNSDSTVTLSNIPTELNPNPYFDDWSGNEDVVVGGGFDSPTGWNLGTNWAIGSGVASSSGSNQYTALSKVLSLPSVLYEILYDIPSYTSGDLRTKFDSNIGTVVNSAGIDKRDILLGGSVLYFEARSTNTILSIDNVRVKKIVPPTGWTASTMDATNYVIEDAEGIKFIEATGTTYIELSGLTNGATYNLSGNIPTYTSGELNAYNGSNETALGSSVTSFNTNITMASTTLRLQVDNNSNLVLGSLSITEYYPETNIKLPLQTEENRYYPTDISWKEGETQYLQNINFNNDEIWVTDTGTTGNFWDIVDGVATHTYLNSSGDQPALSQAVNLPAGDYTLIFNLSVATNARFRIATNIGQIVAFTTYTPSQQLVVDFTLNSAATTFYIRASQISQSFGIDNIRIYNQLAESQTVETAQPTITWNGTDYTLNTVTTEWQDTTLYLEGTGNTDSLIFALSDTAKIDFKINSSLSGQRYKVEYGDNVNVKFLTDISTVGNFSETVTIAHSGSGGSEEVNVTWEVIASTNLFVNGEDQDIDTLDFGTVSNITTELNLILENKSNSQKSVYVSMNKTQWVINGYSPISSIILIPAYSKDTLVVRFNPLEDATYQDTLYILSNFTSSVDTVIFKGIASGLDEPELLAIDLSVTDTKDKIVLSWTDAGDEQYYNVYRKYAGDFSKIGTSTTTAYEDDVHYLTNVSYFVQAVNSLGTQNSDTVTTQQTVNGTYYTLATSGGTYSTIAQVNSSHPAGTTLLIKSGQQFSDALLSCKANSTYATYGGEDRAIIGDTTKIFDIDRTIAINNDGVKVKGLMVLGYKNEADVITFTGENIEIRNCYITGGDGSTSQNYGSGIEGQSVENTNIKIIGNTIRNLRDGINIREPYNVEIAYNTIYDVYAYNGRVNYNAGTGIRTGGNVINWDAEYTYHIHHNEIYNFEAMAIEHVPSNTLIEYNEIHSNLDERLFFGGTKHGNVGKLPDGPSSTTGYSTTGTIFRYNYVHNLKKYGEPNVVYNTPTEAQIIARTIPTPITTDAATMFGSSGEVPWYYGANSSGVGTPSYSYGIFYNNDVKPVTYLGVTDNSTESPDNVISGIGYYNMWIHNNIFANIENKIFSHAGRSDGVDRMDYGTHYVNNTLYNVGGGWFARNNLVTLEYTESPLYFVNNIIDYDNSTAKYVGYYKGGDMLFMDYNLYTRQDDGYTINSDPVSGAQNFARYNSTDVNNWTTENQQYMVSADWEDTTTTFFAPNIGVSGVWLPDLRIKQGGNAYNTGKPYSELGDTYSVTSLIGDQAFGGTLGEDPTGREFAYDILGNYRTTNDMGALGIPTETIENVTPIILTHPENVLANVGDTIQYSVVANLSGGAIGYQWWKMPETIAITDGDSSKYEGSTSNTLTIKDITTSDAASTYLCEVKNLNGYPADGYWVNSNSVGILLDVETLPGSDRDTLTIAQGTDDIYVSGAYLNSDLDYVKSGLDGTVFTAGMIFTGMNDWTQIDSAKIFVTTRNTRTGTWDYNLRYENANNPSTFSTYANYASRTYIAENDDNVITATWTDNVTYEIDVTNGLRALNDDFSYGSTDIGRINITFFGTDATTARAWDSYEGNVKAYGIIYGTK